MSLQVNEIVRVPAYSGGFRVWRVDAVLLGALNHESVYRLVTLDRYASDSGPLLVPCELLEAALAATPKGE